jgi:hypothetical protein
MNETLFMKLKPVLLRDIKGSEDIGFVTGFILLYTQFAA